MKRVIGMLFILALSCYLAVYLTFLSIPAAEVFNDVMPAVPVSANKALEESLYGFISNNLAGREGGIFTNLQKYKGSRDTLSESVGLMMNYCILSNNKKQYDKQFNFLQNNLLADSKFIMWRTGESGADCNAAIDDLRIVRALLDGYDTWGSKDYYNLAGNLQDNIFKYQIRERCLYELYDWKSGRAKPTTPLCYLDLYTMDRLSEFNPKWLGVEEKALSIIADGRIGSDSPFFYKYYDYDKGSYAFDEEYSKQKGICLTYTLFIVLHLAEVNEETGFFTEWLRNEMNDGRLYAWYDPFTLKPVNTVESTAVYALAAVYAEKTGERELCRKLVNGMMKFMVTDRKSAYYGGFGNPKVKYFHSFDNLMALWALSVSGR